MTNSPTENIELTLPVNSAYVSTIRLTASSIANRINFDIDEIEDIKAAVSEACSFIIKKSKPEINFSFKVNFIILEHTIEILISSENMDVPESIENEMGLVMIKALSDLLEIKSENKCLIIRIIKTHKENNLLL